MNSGEQSLSPLVPWHKLPRATRLRTATVVAWIGLITAVFIQPLTKLLVHAAQSDLYSYIPMIPLVSGYLIYRLRTPAPSSDRLGFAMGVSLAAIAAASGVIAYKLQESLSANDYLALISLSYIGLVGSGGVLFLGRRWIAAAVFPITFLIFMVPLPDAAVNWIETTSVLASADVSAFFFTITGTPLLRDGTRFALPGIVIRVAQECSGIHSSWVLLITSLLASHLFLTSTWRRFVLVAFVIPLGIIRNGFRILVIGLLCVHVGPQMIDSPIHHQGGPIFFALSLVPLLMFMGWLRRGEQKLNVSNQDSAEAQLRK